MKRVDRIFAEMNGDAIWGIVTTPVYGADDEPLRGPDGEELTFEQTYGSGVVPYVELTGMDPMPAQGWIYDGESFSPPPDNTPTIPQQNESMREGFLQQARIAMVPLLMSLQLDNATDDESILAKKWQDYYRALQSVDTSVVDVVWPVRPEDPV